MIHDWCGHLDDPAGGHPCPCTANTVTRREVERRHQVAVLRAMGRRVGRRRGAAAGTRRRAAA